MARTLRYSTEVASSHPRPPSAVLPRLKAPGNEGGESAGFFLQLANDFEVIDALVECFAHAEHHGGGGAHAELMGGAMHADPVFGAALQAGDALANFVVEDFGAAAGDGVESCVAQAGDGGAQVEFAVLGDGEDLRCGEAVQPDFWEALLDAGEAGVRTSRS